MSRRSKRLRRPVKRSILIVCEGEETERNYFDGLKRTDEVSGNYTVRVIPGKGGSRLQIVQNAVKKNISLAPDECWCVFDTERLNNSETVKDFQDAVALGKANSINLAISNPSIEVWLIAHFERTSRQFKDSDAAEAYLNKHLQAAVDVAYAKNDKDIFKRLREKVDDAIANAGNVRDHDHGHKEKIEECNSSTTVDLLVSKLKQPPAKKKRK